MKTKRKDCWKGFTFAETLVVIALMTAAAVMTLPLIFSSLKFAQINGITQKNDQDLLAMKSGLLWVCGQIAPPVWANPTALVRKEGSSILLAYWKGNKDQKVTIKRKDSGALEVRTPEMLLTWGPWTDLKVELWEANGRTIGLAVSVTFSGAQNTWHFPWGASPL